MEKILVVDDNLGIRKFVTISLEKEGYEVIEAFDGESALVALSIHRDINLILLDIMMPKIDGKQLLEKLKFYKEEFGVDVCMMTAIGQRDSIKDCLVLGATDYIVKPIDKEFLIEKVYQLLNGATKSSFFECKVEASGRLLKPGGSIDIELRRVSEYEVLFSCDEKLPTPLKAVAKIPLLETVLDNENSFFLSIYKSVNFDGEVLYRASFIGLNEKDSKLVRSATVRREIEHEE